MNLNDYSFEERDPNEPKRPNSGKPFDDPVVEDKKGMSFEVLSPLGNVEEVLRLLCYELGALPMLVKDGDLNDGDLCLVSWDCSTCGARPGSQRARCVHDFGSWDCMATYKVDDPEILRKNNWLYMLIHSGRLERIIRRRDDMRWEGKAV